MPDFLYKVTFLAIKMEESLTATAHALHRGWRIDERALKEPINELSVLFLKINV